MQNAPPMRFAAPPTPIPPAQINTATVQVGVEDSLIATSQSNAGLARLSLSSVGRAIFLRCRLAGPSGFHTYPDPGTLQILRYDDGREVGNPDKNSRETQ